MDISELFRHKLEYAEVIPRSSFETELMHKIARKEFMRFNPLRFNIYYLGMIVAGTIIAGLLIFSGQGDKQKPSDSNHHGNTAASEFINIPRGKAIEKNDVRAENLSVKNKQEKKANEVNLSQPEPKIVADLIRNTVAPAGLNGTLSANPLFKGTSSDKALRSKFPDEEALFEPSVFSGCPPLKVHFSSKPGSFKKYIWSFGDGGYSEKQNPDWVFEMEGEYSVLLNALNSDGSIVTHSVLIKVFPKPEARFEITPAKPVIPDDEIRFLNYSAVANSFSWDFGDGTTSDQFEPKHKYQKFGDYDIRLLLTSEQGCTDSMVIYNAFAGSGYFIEMPNAFIPNPQGPSGGIYSAKSDESAEIFHPSFSGVTDYQLKIFSKLGILLFESDDVNIGWDGYFRGQLSNPGVYIWKIRGNFRNGEPFDKMGDVTLLRN
jgi:PKD repeat protein